MKVFKYCLVLILALSTSELLAQYRYGYFRVGVSSGTTHYLGDLDNDFTFQFTKPGLGIDGSYRLNPIMSTRIHFYRGWLKAADSLSNSEPRNRRNLSFRSPVTEFSAQLVFDFIPTERRYSYRPAYTPYVFGGIGIFSFNPQAQLNGQWYDLQPLGTEGQYLAAIADEYPLPYRLTQFCIPMGVGTRFALTKKLDLEIETGFRKTFTDYIDDVSGSYPNLDDLRASNPVAAILSDRIDRTLYPQGAGVVNGIRGDRTQQDWYIYSCVRVSYIIDWVKCPQF
ncbi:MAG: hypothetical protein EAZ89_19370 [Bacteroidetes bacterium]|nr:MAG: hypothetical protein EAZ89_19370 [Bacteroidota bacterium]